MVEFALIFSLFGLALAFPSMTIGWMIGLRLAGGVLGAVAALDRILSAAVPSSVGSVASGSYLFLNAIGLFWCVIWFQDFLFCSSALDSECVKSAAGVGGLINWPISVGVVLNRAIYFIPY